MATTADDWTYIKTLTAITAEGNIPIDLIAQTVGNINVDVKEAITMNADITAQSVGNLDVDIKAAAVGNLPINISQQELSHVDIDIDVQSVENLIVSPWYGANTTSTTSSQEVTSENDATLTIFTGAGYLLQLDFDAQPHADINDCSLYPILDNQKLTPRGNFGVTYDEYHFRGFEHPYRVTQKGGAGAHCYGGWVFPCPVYFATNLKVYIWNPTAATQTFNFNLLYWQL